MEEGAGTAMNFLNLNEKALDQHVYRIMSQDYVVSLFSNKTTNVLSQVHNWKDKFENFQLNLGGILDGAGWLRVQGRFRRSVLDAAQPVRGNVGHLCE